MPYNDQRPRTPTERLMLIDEQIVSLLNIAEELKELVTADSQRLTSLLSGDLEHPGLLTRLHDLEVKERRREWLRTVIVSAVVLQIAALSAGLIVWIARTLGKHW